MSFSGNLEHLPIVDIIQLLHSTRKTGTLCLTSHKGESQIVFNGGYIVSANHVRNSIRIGQILVEMGAISSDQLEQALSQQASAGIMRKPLIATLMESGRLKKEHAYAGLENLIEMTIVEILTWKSGSFALDVEKTVISDEYRYFPETLQQEMSLNTQGLLMDALRIYDERMRDGSLKDGAFAVTDTPSAKQGRDIITADDLGLGDLEILDKKIPDVFLGLRDYDASEIHRQKIRESLQSLPQTEQDTLLALLMEFSEPDNSDARKVMSSLAIIFYSRDEFITHCVKTVCSHEHIFSFTTDDEASLDVILEQSFAKELIPVLVIDAPETGTGGLTTDKAISLLRQKLDTFPNLSILQFVAPRDSDFSLRALQSGARSTLARPCGDERDGSFAENASRFVRAFHVYLQQSVSNPDQVPLRHFKECIFELGSQRKVQDVAFVLLKFASTMFERTLTFVVGSDELIAEKGFGITADKKNGASPPQLFRIPLIQQSVFQDVILSGHYFFGLCNDAVLRNHLYAVIGAPHTPRILLLPLKSSGKTIAQIYGDFGTRSGSPLKIDLLDIAVRHAELVLDNNVYRKKLAASGTVK